MVFKLIDKNCLNNYLIFLVIQCKVRYDTQYFKGIIYLLNFESDNQCGNMSPSKCMCKKSDCLRSSPPGSWGGLFSDKSIEVWKNVRGFVESKMTENKSRVFVTTLALKPTIVLASNDLVYEFNHNHIQDYSNGLRDFFYGLFGKSILFASSYAEAKNLSFNFVTHV